MSSNQGQSSLARPTVFDLFLIAVQIGSHESRTTAAKVPDTAGVDSTPVSLHNEYKSHTSQFNQIACPESGSTAWTYVVFVSSIETESSTAVPTAPSSCCAGLEFDSAPNTRDLSTDLSSSTEADAGDARVPDRGSTLAVFDRSCRTAGRCALSVVDSNSCVPVCAALELSRHYLRRDGTRSSEEDSCGSLRMTTSTFAESSTSMTRPAWPPPPKRFLSDLLAPFDFL